MDNMTGKYSIKDLESLTGIKAHTLRIWEQRYAILQPERTDTNIRLYSNEDLKRILNVSALNKSGKKISKIAHLSGQQIHEEVKKLNIQPDDTNGIIDKLIIAMVDLDEEGFSRVISMNSLHHGFEKTVTEIIFPFLGKIGVMWQTDAINPAQEHFVSNIIRQKLISAIDRLKGLSEGGDKILFFLPEGELHEISLLFYTYQAKASGYTVIYLGQSVPMADLKKIDSIAGVKMAVTVITQPLIKTSLQTYCKELASIFTGKKVLISGAQFIKSKIKLPQNLILFKETNEFIQLI